MISKGIRRIIKFSLTHNKDNTNRAKWFIFFDKYSLPEIIEAHRIIQKSI